MADTIYLSDGTIEYNFDEDERPVLDKIIRSRLGDEMADRCKYYFERQIKAGDEETEMIIDELYTALRDIGEGLTEVLTQLQGSKRLDRKHLSYLLKGIQDIVDYNT